jgi:uncharacterized NAD(P)/FAD-binding protein YdhS
VSDHFGRSRRIVIVGAGLGGTATAIRLLQFAREPVEIVLIERRSEYRNAGPAYHRESNHWHHVFNIQAGRISRSGSALWTYPPEHRHRVLTLPPPRHGGDGYDGREDFMRYLCREWERARAIVAREHPEESPAVVTERAAR